MGLAEHPLLHLDLDFFGPLWQVNINIKTFVELKLNRTELLKIEERKERR